MPDSLWPKSMNHWQSFQPVSYSKVWFHSRCRPIETADMVTASFEDILGRAIVFVEGAVQILLLGVE